MRKYHWLTKGVAIWYMAWQICGRALSVYWLMKGMEGPADANKDHKITTGELHRYVLANVSRFQQNQTPELQGDTDRVLVQW